MTERAEESVLVRKWLRKGYRRYEIRRTETGTEVFLLNLLQRFIWEDLAQAGQVNQEALSETIQAAEEARESECWISLLSAVQDHGFMPLGLQKAFVYSAENGELKGYSVALYEGGALIPLIAKDAQELTDIIEAMFSGQRLPKPITYNRSLSDNSRLIVRVPDREDSRLLTHQGPHLIPVFSCQSWLTPSRVLPSITRTEGWRQSSVIAVDPLTEWDEPPAEVIEVASNLIPESPTGQRIKDGLKNILETYSTQSSPFSIIKSWSVFAQRARAEFSREALAATASRALNEMSLDGIETIIEWVENKANRSRLKERKTAARPEGVEDIELRKLQASRARQLYPELDSLSDAALAWCWQHYIQDTEDNSERAGLIQSQRIDNRIRDPDFIIHIPSRAIDQHQSRGERVHDNEGPVVKTMEGLPINIEAKTWFSGVATVLQILLEGRVDESQIHDLLQDWRDHYHRVMRASRQINALRMAVESLETGPVPGTDQDKKYSRYAHTCYDLKIPFNTLCQDTEREG